MWNKEFFFNDRGSILLKWLGAHNKYRRRLIVLCKLSLPLTIGAIPGGSVNMQVLSCYLEWLWWQVGDLLTRHLQYLPSCPPVATPLAGSLDSEMYLQVILHLFIPSMSLYPRLWLKGDALIKIRLLRPDLSPVLERRMCHANPALVIPTRDVPAHLLHHLELAKHATLRSITIR